MIAMRVFMILAALALALIFGFQQLSGFEHLPDGNRTMLIAMHITYAAVAIGLLASLYLIPKANRNIDAFLRAFVVIGALGSLSQCGAWHAKFMGPRHVVSNEAGDLSVEVPSDWMRDDEHNKAADLYVMDWAGTQSLAVTVGDPLEDLDPQAAVDWARETSREQAASKLGAPIDEVSCGPHCAADLFFASARNKPFHFINAARVSCGRLIFVQVVYTAPADIKSTVESEERLSAVQMIKSAACSTKPLAPK